MNLRPIDRIPPAKAFLINMEDPICAVATPNGHSAIGIIRLTGNQTHSLVFRIFRPASGQIPEIDQPKILYGNILDQNEKIDDVLVLMFPQKKSFTGEESAEIQAHGNPLILKKILQCLYKNGFRPANPGEFTQRAFLSGKIDLTEAQAIRDIIDARTERGLQKAILQKDGYLKKKINELRSHLMNLTADFTAELDFSDEDIQFESREKKAENIQTLLDYLNDLLMNSRRFQVFRDGIEIVIIGAPNAGKSSLMNALSGKNRAIVSDIPGTTRDYLETNLEIAGMPVIMVDTAGIRDSQFDSVEKMGIDKTREKIAESDIRIILIDASQLPDKKKFTELKNFLHSAHRHSSLIVLNKTDVVHQSWKDNFDNAEFWNGLFREFELDEELYYNDWKNNILTISAKSGDGLDVLLSRLEDVIKDMIPHTDFLILAAWQEEIMDRIIFILKEVLELVKSTAGEEIIIEHLNLALRASAEFTGEVTTEDLLGRIFSRFCIGK